MSYLLDVYKLKNHQRQFELVEEIECTLLGNKYHEKQVETNQNVSSPTIDHEMKQNIKERASITQRNTSAQIKKVMMDTSQTNRDMFDIDVSDTEQDQKDFNLQNVLGQNNQPNNKLTSGLNSTKEMLPDNGA